MWHACGKTNAFSDPTIIGHYLQIGKIKSPHTDVDFQIYKDEFLFSYYFKFNVGMLAVAKIDRSLVST
jgi:hypothetical protein